MTDTRLADLLSHAEDDAPELRPVYDQFIAGLRALAIGGAAPRVGAEFPPFALPDAAGHFRTLDALIADGPLVLSFNRGGWCPYCRQELALWNEYLPELSAAGGRLVVITAEVGGRAALLGNLLKGDAEILCDVDHGVALSSGLAFFLSDVLQRRYRDEFGTDLAQLYGSGGGLLPVPATFVIDGEGVVRYAFVDPDFRIRAEPAAAIAAVQALGRT